MTWRGVLLGLVGVALLCGLSYFNDIVLGQTALINHNLPITVFGGLIAVVLLLNPLLTRAAPRWAFSGRELAVAVAMVLAACVIPGAGLMRTMTNALMLPHHYERTEPGWKEQGVVEMAPPQMLADPSRNESEALNGFMQGLSSGGERLPVSQVPWYAWTRTFRFWLPVILALWIALICLAVVVHRQWSDHEQLAYPIAQFADSMLPRSGEAQGGVFRNRLFWLGAGPVLLIHLNNYICEWFPRLLIKVPTAFPMFSVLKLFPTIGKAQPFWLFYPHLFFTVIAFSYFLAADVSLALGIGPYLNAYLTGLLLGYGISLGAGGYIALKPQSFLNFGAYFGLFLGIVYTGRHYYFNVFRRAAGLESTESIEPQVTWAARGFLLALALFVGNLIVVGLDWPFALLYAVGIVLIFLVMGRIIAETGLFFIQPYTFPCVLLWGVFGAKAVGPHNLLIMFLVTVVLLVDPREALMPFVVNSLKIVDLQRARVGRAAVACIAALLVGLAIAIPVQLYYQYDRGAMIGHGWMTVAVPKLAFEETVRAEQRLEGQGSLQESESLTSRQRLAEMSPNGPCLIAFVVGLGLVLLFTAGRLRFPRWPLHPVMFLVWNSYPGQVFAPSFLLGWLIKVVVTKYGGAAIYQRLKPLMFGLVAGEMIGGSIPILFGLAYYWVTGEIPKRFSIMAF